MEFQVSDMLGDRYRFSFDDIDSPMYYDHLVNTMCDSPVIIDAKAKGFLPVPCGRCPPCKFRRVNSWVFRLMQEEKVSTSAHFVTLTYATEHVPISHNGRKTLSKRDWQLYMKRLRKLCPGVKLKYYVAGEYGTHTYRPHYHAIVFNCPNIDYFHDAWGLGQIHVGQVTSSSVAYTMKYIDKASGNSFYGSDDREPEFSLMSKNLGLSYLSDDIVKYHKADLSRMYVTKPGGVRVAMPRYYRLKIFDKAEQLKQLQIVQRAMASDDVNKRLEFDRLYYDNPDYTFEERESSARYSRHSNFYRSQNRDTL